jgi:hypothetical protein
MSCIIQESKFFDGRLAPKPSGRQKRAAFKFVEPGKFQKEGQRVRMKAQLEKLQVHFNYQHFIFCYKKM